MEITQEHIDQIKSNFGQIQSKKDLLQLMNIAKSLVYGEKSVPFKLQQITYYSSPKLSKKRYSSFTIKKKSGNDRTINAPVKGLKAIQRVLGFILQCVFEPHPAAFGFAKNKSIVDNASIHIGSRYVYNIDLKDFFSSIDQARVWKCFQLKPFNLNIEFNITREELIPSDTFTYHTEIITRNKVWLQNGQQVYLFEYDGLKLKQGQNNLKPKIGGNIYYEVLKYSDDQSGEIYVIIDKSDLENLKSFAKENSEKNNEEYYLTFMRYLYNSIINHSKNLFEKDTRSNLSNVLASLCCAEMDVERRNEAGEWETVKRNVLPQGAPTSPVITNIVCQRLDYLLTGVAKRFGLKYSRYADDITFSSMHNVYQTESEFLQELHRIIEEQNFHIKESKTRLQKDGYRKEVTGLLVNEKANVQQRYIKQLRMWLYYWERYGYERASGFFLQQYIADKGHVKNGKPDMANVISGKLDYLKMVKGADNQLYQKLKARFENLTGKVASVSENLIEIEEAGISNTPLMKLSLGLAEQPMVLSEEKIIDISTKVKTEEKPIPVFHKPKELVALLKNFSVNDSALKYTTHSWDAGRDANMFKDLSEFLSIAKSQYSEFSYALKGLSENLNGKIYNFLFNKEIAKFGWGDINPKKRIYFGWSSPELLEACKNDISLNPEDFILPEQFQIQRSGKTLQKFKHIIDVFKNEIEVRDENSALLNLILQKHDNYLISFSAPQVSNLENKTFYTDIQWLSKALDLIFKGIQDRPQHQDVEYFVTENNSEKLILNILHKNSFKKGISIRDEKLNLTRGDFGPIKNYLMNLCDWSIESEFAEGAFRINYLVSDNEIPAYEKVMSAEGFKHILTFYK